MARGHDPATIEGVHVPCLADVDRHAASGTAVGAGLDVGCEPGTGPLVRRLVQLAAGGAPGRVRREDLAIEAWALESHSHTSAACSGGTVSYVWCVEECGSKSAARRSSS